MKIKSIKRMTIALAALLVVGTGVGLADDRGRDGRWNGGGRGGNYRGNYGSNYGGNQYSNRGYSGGGNRYYSGPNYYVAPRYVGPRYVAPVRPYYGSGFSAGFSVGRFYPNRGYFYGGSFWARPYFGVGVGIPFGYGYRTPRGCGWVDEFGQFYPAPCY